VEGGQKLTLAPKLCVRTKPAFLMGNHAMDDRLRIPQDHDYFQAVGLAAIAFARLEWNAVWCHERLQPGYILKIESEKKTAGIIGKDIESIFSKIIDPIFRMRVEPLAKEFRDVVEQRNALVHGKPGTTPNGDQRLFRHGSEWSINAVNAFSDRCVRAGEPLNALLYNELKKPCSVALMP
jgi:hypothetical protein